MECEDAKCSKEVRNVMVSIVAYLEAVPRHSPINITVCLNPVIQKRKSQSKIKNIKFLCHVMPYSSVEISRRFVQTYCHISDDVCSPISDLPHPKR